MLRHRGQPRLLGAGRRDRASSSATTTTTTTQKEAEATPKPQRPTQDPRVTDLGRAIEDDFATIREHYGVLSV